ncbi:MAG: hypothetical protein Q7S58_03935 [Candidatus Binatus sp.]|uniref:hypothetical protein n=1 Tax=Candidatus Binatus sp. TaxID=2811406 RepID=UPI002725FC11|nr:hypothetical protein [Candidatus Binatus sp.]MDO8431541.1 hypothetical protein [Candidatus Binatus sp.]
MSWHLEDIERNWLKGAAIAVTPEELVDAFDRTEAIFGREWLRARNATAWGAAPTLEVVRTGIKLAALDGVVGAEKLIERVRAGETSADAELTAVYLLRHSRSTAEIELYPPISVANRTRVPDFRVRDRLDPWTYIEVARPDISDTQRRANSVLGRLTEIVYSLKKSFTLEVFLLREPTDGEIEQLATDATAFCRHEGLAKEYVGNLAILLLNHAPPNVVTPYIHPEDDHRPRLAMARVIAGGDEPARHVSVRMPYADERAEVFLNSEAEQLPKNAPGFIMIDVSRAPGGIKSWVPLLRRRLQPQIHTRVGGIGLFTEGFFPTDSGLKWIFETALIANSHAKLPPPEWIGLAVAEAGSAESTPT